MRLLKTLTLLLFSFALPAFAAPNASFSYEGYLTDPSDNPVTTSTASVQFSIIGNTGTDCLLYSEDHTNVTITNGHFSLRVGAGSPTFSSSANLPAIFENDGVIAGSSCNFNSQLATGYRILRVTVNGATFGDIALTEAPRATIARRAETIGTSKASNLLRVDNTAAASNTNELTPAQLNQFWDIINGVSSTYEKSGQLNGAALPGAVSNGQSLRFNGSSWDAYTPAAGWTAVDATSSIKGIVTVPVTGGLTVTGGALSLADVVTAGTYSKVTVDNKGRVNSGAVLSEGDLPSISTAGKVSGNAITSGTVGGSTAINTSGNVTATNISSVLAKTKILRVYKTDDSQFVGLIASPSQTVDYDLTLPINAGLPGQVLTSNGTGILSWKSEAANSITTTPSGSISSTDVQSAIAELDVDKVAKAGDTMSGTLNLPANGLVAGTSQLVLSGGNVGVGATNPATKLDVLGTLRIGNGAETCSATTSGGLRYSGGQIQFCNASSWQTLGVSGVNITSLNSQTGALQSFAVDAAGLTPAITSSSNTHTLSIPKANASGVTSGTISKTEFDAFNAKQPAGNYLTGLTGDLTATGPGTVAALISNDAITSAKIADGSIVAADLNSAVSNGLWAASAGNIYRASGNVGIGTNTPPAYSLDVNGQVRIGDLNAATSYAFSLQRTGSTTSMEFLNGTNPTYGSYIQFNSSNLEFKNLTGAGGSIGFYNGSPTTENLRITGAGKVGIGTTSPGYKLDVVGDINSTGCVRGSSGSLGGTCFSDARLKTDVHHFNLGLPELLQIQPRLFKYNGLGGLPVSEKLELGVIAQEIEAVAPTLITHQQVKLHPEDTDKTEISQVNYTSFTYILINAVKELYHELKGETRSLREELATVKAENQQMKAHLCQKDPSAGFCSN